MILSEDHVSFQYDEGFKVYNQEDSNPIFDIDSHELEIQGRKKLPQTLSGFKLSKDFQNLGPFKTMHSTDQFLSNAVTSPLGEDLLVKSDGELIAEVGIKN